MDNKICKYEIYEALGESNINEHLLNLFIIYLKENKLLTEFKLKPLAFYYGFLYKKYKKENLCFQDLCTRKLIILGRSPILNETKFFNSKQLFIPESTNCFNHVYTFCKTNYLNMIKIVANERQLIKCSRVNIVYINQYFNMSKLLYKKVGEMEYLYSKKLGNDKPTIPKLAILQNEDYGHLILIKTNYTPNKIYLQSYMDLPVMIKNPLYMIPMSCVKEKPKKKEYFIWNKLTKKKQ